MIPKKIKNYIFLFSLVGFISLSFNLGNDEVYSLQKLKTNDYGETPVMDILVKLGLDKPHHYMETYDEELANVGEKLITEGRASYKGKRGKRISSYFQCTDCHSLVKETEKLNDDDADARLSYAIENDLPFYPASTLHGLYNRESFYNDDYYKKYGDMVFDARDSIHNAIQLCAKYCASGRYLEDWELDAMLHYFKREEIKIKEVDPYGEMAEEIVIALESGEVPSTLFHELKTSYISAFSATFTGAKLEEERMYGAEGNALRGEQIYERSCIHCHGNARVTYLSLGKDVLSGKYLWNNRKGYDDESVYQVVRWGTYPKQGRRQYMPLYTHERMTEDQVEDLMAYIKVLANK